MIDIFEKIIFLSLPREGCFYRCSDIWKSWPFLIQIPGGVLMIYVINCTIWHLFGIKLHDVLFVTSLPNGPSFKCPLKYSHWYYYITSYFGKIRKIPSTSFYFIRKPPKCVIWPDRTCARQRCNVVLFRRKFPLNMKSQWFSTTLPFQIL